MSRKTERLIRDIAELFVKYSLSDWQPVLSELSASGSHKQLAEAIENQLKQTATKAKAVRKSVAEKKNISRRKVAKDKGPISAEIVRLKDAMISRRILSNPNDLKMTAEAIGIKDDLPTNRRDAVERIVKYLENLPQDSLRATLDKFRRALQSSKSDQGAEFERWADLILRSERSD